MSGFDKDWLTLREPADRDARSPSLLQTFNRYISSAPPPRTILDIGCGTGSTYRTLAPALPDATWKLLDYEATLLEEAKRQIGEKDSVEFLCRNLNQLDDAMLDGVSMVTASALFDLCSAQFSDRFAAQLVGRNIGLYAALNYDGQMQWTVRHPLDEQVVEAFNRHQHFDKGFGPALGPDATDHLSSLFEASGFSVSVATSPWQMRGDMAELQMAFLAGLKRPILEIGNIEEAAFSEWLDFRLSQIGSDDSVCIVGHTDLLALPNR